MTADPSCEKEPRKGGIIYPQEGNARPVQTQVHNASSPMLNPHPQTNSSTEEPKQGRRVKGAYKA